MAQLHPAFIAALEAERIELNQRFKQSSAQGPALDGQLFQSHLIECVEPIVAAVAACFPERTRLATRELYLVSLALFRAHYWGAESRIPELNILWQAVLPKLAHLVAREPERVSGSLSNALINLSRYPVRIPQWLDQIGSVGSACQSVSQLLQIGQVLAWRCGLPLVRSRSMDLIGQLPRTLVSQALGLKASPDDATWSALVDQIQKNRWYDPAETSRSATAALATSTLENSICEVGRVGQYRGLSSGLSSGAGLGLGGGFTNLPIVYLVDDQLHASDQVSSWRIEVDCYGCILQRVGDAPAKLPHNRPHRRPAPREDAAFVDPQGRLRWDGQQRSFPYLADSTSQACDGQTLAVTLGNSFHIFLMARL